MKYNKDRLHLFASESKFNSGFASNLQDYILLNKYIYNLCREKIFIVEFMEFELQF